MFVSLLSFKIFQHQIFSIVKYFLLQYFLQLNFLKCDLNLSLVRYLIKYEFQIH